jgi:hypothetical protein
MDDDRGETRRRRRDAYEEDNLLRQKALKIKEYGARPTFYIGMIHSEATTSTRWISALRLQSILQMKHWRSRLPLYAMVWLPDSTRELDLTVCPLMSLGLSP